MEAKMNSEQIYLTTDGTRLNKADFNKHHSMYPKSRFKSPIEKAYKNMGGMVLPTVLQPHRELHARSQPPIKPSAQLMTYAVNYNATLDDDLDPYQKFDEMIKFFGQLTGMSGNIKEVKQASSIHDNLLEQRPFIQSGRVVIL